MRLAAVGCPCLSLSPVRVVLAIDMHRKEGFLVHAAVTVGSKGDDGAPGASGDVGGHDGNDGDGSDGGDGVLPPTPPLAGTSAGLAATLTSASS